MSRILGAAQYANGLFGRAENSEISTVWALAPLRILLRSNRRPCHWGGRTWMNTVFITAPPHRT